VVMTASVFTATVSAQTGSSGDIKSSLYAVKVGKFDWYSTDDVPDWPALRGQRPGSPQGYPPNSSPEPQPPPAESRPIPGFIYRIEVLNGSGRRISLIAWEYRFVDVLEEGGGRSIFFESKTDIKPQSKKTISERASSPPSFTVTVGSLLKKQSYVEQVVIRRIECRPVTGKQASAKEPCPQGSDQLIP
jgi:hypothetical protein